MTPKFREHDRTVRDDKRKAKAETQHRQAVRAVKYQTVESTTETGAIY